MDRTEFWATIGVTDTDRHVYRSLIQDPEPGVDERAKTLGLDPSEVATAIDRLVRARLAHEAGGRVEALEPRVAVSSLARRRQAVLDQAQAVAAELADEFAAAVEIDEPRLRVLRAHNVTRLVVEALESATRTIDALVAPPVATDSATGSVEFDALRRGVVIRSIVDARVFTEPTLQANLATAQSLGEQIRLVPDLATKLLVIDRTTVIVPLPDATGHVRAVIGDFPALTGLIQSLFDHLWTNAAPVEVADPLTAGTHAHSPDVDHRVLELLALGLSDAAICRQLGVSDRTLRRRITALQERHGVATRFQLGMATARAAAGRSTDRRADEGT